MNILDLPEISCVECLFLAFVMLALRNKYCHDTHISLRTLLLHSSARPPYGFEADFHSLP